ncbi:MAG TPA: hypothetical protein VMB79_14625 [Jatrophihabitans sp.]|nr:hypothetical protein [Jatrophihabitans sp.]
MTDLMAGPGQARLSALLLDLVTTAGCPHPAELVALTAADPLPAAFAPEGEPPEAAIAERIAVLPRVWPPFAAWWRDYFAGEVAVSLLDLWRLYLPFAQWIVRQKRRHRPGAPFVVGFNGSPGAGKTVLTNALAVVLDQLLDPEREGRAVARSGDDWYLGRAEREPLRARGYDPGLPGVSNRSLPGTHDLAWLERNLRELEHTGPDTVLWLGNFDKRADDQPGQAFEVRGRVGVLLFDLWFAGAETDVEPARLPAGLRREVATELRRWRGVFDRLDALWAFEWPSFEQMLHDREAQERLVEQRRGTRGMTAEQLGTFMSYMVERSWDWQLTSPVPPPRGVTFHARRGPDHRVICVRRGERAS